ncbi:MAG: hypothetical protein FD144_3603 [Rhodospirillaceae bacterium]|nr:MAG: hypothetical protein FD144_3603 [Rhodospirillaceae bacterium]
MADAFETAPQQQATEAEGPGAANREMAPTTGPDGSPATPEPGAEAAAEAPADYSGLRLPDGYRADDPVFGEAMKLFGSEKIAPETAQKLIDFTVERDREIARAVNEHAASSWMKQTTEWRTTSEKEFSPEALGNARAALAKVFDRQTIAYLEGLGFTNHPGLIRGMVKVASAIKDDSFVGGNAGRGTGAMDPKALYPNSQHN